MSKQITIMSRYHGYGDAILVNTIAWHYGEKHQTKVLVGTNHPIIFQNNPWVKIFPSKNEKTLYRYARILRFLGFEVFHFTMQYLDLKESKTSLLNLLSNKCGLTPQQPLQPLIFFKQKIKKMQWANNSKPWIAIQSSGRKDWTDNRNWIPEYYLKLSRLLKPNYNIVQIGYPLDPIIEADIDLRGKTEVIDLFSILSSVNLFIGQVGFLMHAAESVECSSIIIYGGFEWPEFHLYKNQITIKSKVDCAPCFTLNCPYDKKCMREITVEQVLNSVHSFFASKQNHSSTV